MSEGDDVVRLPAPWLKYVTAAMLSGLVAVVVIALPWSIPKAGFLLLNMLAIILSAYAGGFGPGLLATGIGSLSICYLMLPPVYSLHVAARADMVVLGSFASIGFLAAWILDWVNQRG